MKTSWMLAVCLFVTVSLPIKCAGQNYEDAFNAIMAEQFSPEGPGGTVLVAREGKAVFKKSYGQADLELGVAMKTDHVFRIGSLTKQFTAVAILKLAEEGKLSLQDDITKFIKDYPTHGHTIRIEHLLTHSSGISNYTGLPKWTPQVRRQDLTPIELIDLFKDEPMDFAPGEDFRYSNSGYILLGYIVELVSGKSYATYIEENFFHPLAMNNSLHDSPAPIIHNRVVGYQKRNGQFENADFLSMTLPYSAGSLLSNVDDLLTWYNALMNDKVINKKSLEKAHTSYKLNNGRITGYGYGWEVGNIQGSPTIKHVGRINGFVTYCVYLPAEKIFVAIFSNCDCTDNLENPASRMAAVILGKPFQRDEIKLSTKALESYQGVYAAEYEGQKIISCENERLLYFSKGGSKAQLIPFEKDKFLLENGLSTLEFDRNSAGAIISFNLKSTGMTTRWNRTAEEIQTMNAIKIVPGTLEKYVGNYQFSPGPVFSVVREGDKLYGQVGQDKKEILPFGKHKFFAKEIDARIIFNVDRNGKVISLTKIQSDAMDAKRIE